MKTYKDWELSEGTWSSTYQIFFKSDAGKGNVEGTLKGKAKNAKDAEKQADKALNKEADKVEKDKKIRKKHGTVEVYDAYLGKIVFKEHWELSEATWSAPYQIFFKSDAGKGNVEGTLKGTSKSASAAYKDAGAALEKEADKIEKDKKIRKKHGTVEVDDAYMGKLIIKEHKTIADKPVEDDNMNIADLADAKVLKAVNAFVGSMNDTDYLSAGQAIAELRQKLARIGVTFANVAIGEASGQVSLPLEQWGGRYGKDGSQASDEIINDDGISHRVDGGLSLNIEYNELDNGRCEIIAKIA